MSKTEVDEQEVFRFLDALREGGKINMFGAPPYIQEMFGVTREEARTLFGAWTKQFGKGPSA